MIYRDNTVGESEDRSRKMDKLVQMLGGLIRLLFRFKTSQNRHTTN